MPSPKHQCAFPGCERLLPRKETIHCRFHYPRTEERNLKLSAALKGRPVSDESRKKMSESRRGPGATDRLCAGCGAPFSVGKPSSRVQFCSRACGYASRRGSLAPNFKSDMPSLPCKVCGKTSRSRASSKPQALCSRRCNSIWNKLHQPTVATKIERMIEAELRARGWLFLAQGALLGRTIVDFLLPAFNVAIYCDGTYWHNLPGRPEKDARITQLLESNGFRVFRFAEPHIKVDARGCVDRVAQFIERGV